MPNHSASLIEISFWVLTNPFCKLVLQIKVGAFDSVTAALEAAQDIIEQSGEADQAWFSLNKVGFIQTWVLQGLVGKDFFPHS
jgi:hypothetical protein